MAAKKKIIIAIDGFSSCGKSTVAKQLAEVLHYDFIDSGAMYRAITLYFIRHYIDPQNPEEVQNALKNIQLDFVLNPHTKISELHLNGENVAHLIREMTVAERVSEVAAVKAVREFAVKQQQNMGKRKGIVMDGRDIGTVVFPDAELKIFLTADPDVRVKRRFLELYAGNPNITIEEVQQNLAMRDYVDSNREESPLRKAKDAIEINNSNLNKEEQLQKLIDLVEEKLNP